MTLEHKEYILPEVDLSHDEGDPEWHAAQATGEAGSLGETPLYRADGTVYSYRLNGRPPGHYRFYWEQCIVEEWAQTVARYEAGPDDVYAAYWYLDGHPVFWKFDQEQHPDYPPDHVSKLEHDMAWFRNSIEIRPHKWDGQLAWSYEFGPWDLLPVDHQGWTGQCHYHDYKLDGQAPSYEQAVTDIAFKVWYHYGNDRVKVQVASDKRA